MFFAYNTVEGPLFDTFIDIFALFCQTYGLLQSVNVALMSLIR